MPWRERLAQKGILQDTRRLRTALSGAGGAAAPHTLLGVVHSDTVVGAPVEGALVLANATPQWDILLPPGAAGYALVSDATTWTIDQTPTWTGSHAWDDGAGDSPANLFVGGSNDDTFTLWLEDDAVAGNSDFIVKFPAYDTDTRFIWRDSLDVDVAYVDADGNEWLEGDLMLTDDAFVGISGGGRLVFDTTPAPDQVEVTSADLNFVTANHGIIHVDGVGAGYVLLGNGTRYLPAPANANLPVAPNARGDIIRAEAGPVWAAYSANTLGAVLIGDGNDIISDTTPSIAGLTTFGNGWLNSAGTGDLNGTDLIIDTDGDSYLHASADDVVDFVLATATGELGITINGAEDFAFTANSFTCSAGSSIYLDEYFYHSGDTDTYLRFQADTITLRAGGADMIHIVEAASDYVIVNDTALDGNQSGNVLEVHDGYFGIQGEDGEPAVAQIFSYGSTAADDMAILRLRRARNTQAAPSAVQSGDAIGRIGGGGYGASTYPSESTAYIQFLAAENFTDAAMGTHMQFATTPTSSTTPAEVMRLSASGRLKQGGDFGTINAQAHILQDAAAGAIPVLELRQDDFDYPFITFHSTATVGDINEAIVDYGDEAGSTPEAWVKVYVRDDGNQVADQAYYILLWTLS